MMLVELAEAPEASLPVARLKDHLRLGSGFGPDAVQDALLAGFLRAALAAVEARTGKALIRRAFALTLSEWRGPDRQPIPLAPVAAVASVTLRDAAGASTVAPASLWILDPDAHRPALQARGAALPAIPAQGSATVVFDAGYGADWSAVPPDLAQAALMLAAHYHDHRENTALGPGCMPFGVSALIERYRPLRLGASA